MEHDADEEGNHVDDEGHLLDLFVRCQCSFYPVAPDVIPSVIPAPPRPLLEDFAKLKTADPPPGKSKELSVLRGWLMILTYVAAVVAHAVSADVSVCVASWRTGSGRTRAASCPSGLEPDRVSGYLVAPASRAHMLSH